MEFLNKKEEVIDLVLTRRGKELYAAEGFDPCYYAFFDDEVLYNKAYASDYSTPSAERQNEAESRIRNAVVLKAQSEWTGSLAGDDANLFGRGPNYRYNNHWGQPIGKSTNFNNYKPAWDIRVIEGYISASGEMTTDDTTGISSAGKTWAGYGASKINSPIPAVKHIPFEEDRSIKGGSVFDWEKEYFGERIPQIQLYCDYLTFSTVDFVQIAGETPTIELLQDAGKIQKSDDYAVVQKRSSDNFVFSIKEENVDESDSENFTLEIFKYEYGQGTNADDPTPTLKRLYFSADEPLKFLKDKNKKGDWYISADEDPLETVEYYFNVMTDKDVDEKLDIKYIYDDSALAAPAALDECK